MKLLIFTIYLSFLTAVAYAQVYDGQQINAAVTNAAYWKRNTSDTGYGTYSLDSSSSSDGTFVNSIQESINACDSFTGLPANSVHNALPAWANNDVGISTDPLKTRADLLTQKFNATAGHKHSGAAGDGPQLPLTALAPSVNNSMLGVNNSGGVIEVPFGPSGQCLVFTGTTSNPTAGPCGTSGTPSPLTTKGDLWGFSTTNVRIPVGTDGTVLTADSTSPYGVSYQAGGSGGGGGIRYSLSGGVTNWVGIDGTHRITTAMTLSTVSITELDSGLSGSTTIQLNQYRSGTLYASATASLSANGGLPNTTHATLSSTLSLAANDILSIDVIGVPSGDPQELSVEVNTSDMAGPVGPTGATGGSSLALSTKTSNYTLTASDSIILADATSGPITLTLPSASVAYTSGQTLIFIIKKIDSTANSVTISSSNLIDGQSSQVLNVKYQSIETMSNGVTYYVK